ncbi:MAG TPA: hypothetical protein QF800_01705, partial [Phycisphaerales bacterium]|nr:hypothetical protein [Phycisphaerales bacterium]
MSAIRPVTATAIDDSFIAALCPYVSGRASGSATGRQSPDNNSRIANCHTTTFVSANRSRVGGTSPRLTM